MFADSLVPTVRKALCDPLPEVREAAAKTFDNLHTNIGNRALNDILPDLLDKLVSSLFNQIYVLNNVCVEHQVSVNRIVYKPVSRKYSNVFRTALTFSMAKNINSYL